MVFPFLSQLPPVNEPRLSLSRSVSLRLLPPLNRERLQTERKLRRRPDKCNNHGESGPKPRMWGDNGPQAGPVNINYSIYFRCRYNNRTSNSTHYQIAAAFGSVFSSGIGYRVCPAERGVGLLSYTRKSGVARYFRKLTDLA